MEWMPFELRPLPYETLSPNSDYIQSSWESSVQPLAARFGVKMDLPLHLDPLPHTHLAHEGQQFAKLHGKGTEYAEAVLKAFWQEGQNIGEIDALSEIAESIGLDQASFKQALEKRKFADEHRKALKEAYEVASISAVPTFFIGNRKVQGLHTKEMLEKMILEESSSTLADGNACGIDGC